MSALVSAVTGSSAAATAGSTAATAGSGAAGVASAGATAAAQTAASAATSTIAKTAMSTAAAAPTGVLQTVTNALTSPVAQAITSPGPALTKGVSSIIPGRFGEIIGSLVGGDIGGVAEAATKGTRGEGFGKAISPLLRGQPSQFAIQPREDRRATRQEQGLPPEEAQFFQDILAPILLGANVGQTLVRARSQTLGARQFGQAQQEATSAGLPGLAGGGTILPGGSAVVGEVGPEIATATPAGTEIVPVPSDEAIQLRRAAQTPQTTQANVTGQLAQAQTANELTSTAVRTDPATQPTAADTFPGPQAAVAAPIEAPGFAGKAFELLQDGLILAESLKNPSLFLQQRTARAEAQRGIAEAALKNPTLLEISPTVVSAFEAIHGQGTAQAFLENQHPGVANANIAVAFDVPILPEGEIDANGQVVPQPLEQLTTGLRARGVGFKIDSEGRIQVNVPAASFQERSQAASFGRWDEVRSQFVQEGIPAAQANVLAASQTISDMTGLGLIPDERLFEMATADTTTLQAAAKARLVKRGQLYEELGLASQLNAEKASGTRIGTAIANSQIPFMSVTVPQADGTTRSVPITNAAAIAATGSNDAISLGTNPSKTQLEVAGQRADRLMTAPGGEIVAVPNGVGLGIPATAILQGADSIQALKQVTSVAQRLVTPEMLRVHPSEAGLGRGFARTTGFFQSFVRQFTDPAEVATTRGQAAQLGFQLARLLGSNSQLSDAERANAQRPFQPIIDGTASREQVVAGVTSLYAYATEADRRVQRREAPVDGVDEVADRVNRLPQGVDGLSAVLADRVNAQLMSHEEAIAVIRGATE